MKRYLKVFSLASVLILAMALVWGGVAGAHGSKSVEGISISFGGTDEPVITGMRSWIQITVKDEVTGEPVQGLQEEDRLVMTLSNGEWSRRITMGAVRGTPGAYKAAVWFQAAGTYDFTFSGTKADGTEFAIKFDKDIADHTDLFFPPVSK